MTVLPAGSSPGRQRHRRDDAVQLHLAFDRAVEMEVPAERVVVVADGDHRVEHETPRPPHLDSARQLVAVLPEQPRVLLVDADRVPHDARPAFPIDEVRVEVADLADAIAAQLERVRACAETVFAGIEVGAPGVERMWLSVGHDHLRAGRAVEHRAAVEAHVVQHEAFLRIDRRRAASSGTSAPRCPRPRSSRRPVARSRTPAGRHATGRRPRRSRRRPPESA